MTVNKLRAELNRLIQDGLGELQVVYIDPSRAEDYFNKKLKEKPLITIEDLWIRRNCYPNGQLDSVCCVEVIS